MNGEIVNYELFLQISQR